MQPDAILRTVRRPTQDPLVTDLLTNDVEPSKLIGYLPILEVEIARLRPFSGLTEMIENTPFEETARVR